MRIPEYDSKVNPPPGLQAPTISPSAASAAYRGVAQLGKAVEDLGLQIQEQKDNISRTEELTRRITGAERDVADLNNQLDMEQDPDTAMQKFDEGFDEIREKWMEGVEDSKVLNALTKHFGTREYQEATSMKHKTLEWTIQRGQANVIEQLDEYAKIAGAPGKTEDDWNRNLELAFQLLDNARDTGLYSPDKVADLKKKTKKNFIMQRYNRMIDDDPELAIRNVAWLQQIGDSKVELELLSKAVTWAQRTASMQEKEFREKSGALLNRMLLDINSGRMNRGGVTLVVGSGQLTDEHERILMNEMDQYEEQVTKKIKSDPERLGYWKSEIEYAALRKDEGALRSFVSRILADPQIAGEDRAVLFATLNVKLGKTDTESKEFKEGYTQAIDEADKYCEYNSFERRFGNPKKKALHRELIQKIQDASAGKQWNPKTGKIERIPKYEGWRLVVYARQLIAEDRDKEEARRAQEKQKEDSFRIPPSGDQRGK
jgi:hypothetical protein